jgi:hypothetical protein
VEVDSRVLGPSLLICFSKNFVVELTPGNGDDVAPLFAAIAILGFMIFCGVGNKFVLRGSLRQNKWIKLLFGK